MWLTKPLHTENDQIASECEFITAQIQVQLADSLFIVWPVARLHQDSNKRLVISMALANETACVTFACANFLYQLRMFFGLTYLALHDSVVRIGAQVPLRKKEFVF